MRQRGRKSVAARSLAVIDGDRGSRPSPPADLSDFEAALWSEVIGSMPADWFRGEMLHMLRAYCRACRMVHELDHEDDLLPDGNLPLKLKLNDARDKMVRQMVLLARSLRLTPQSRTDPITAARKHRKAGEDNKSQPWHG